MKIGSIELKIRFKSCILILTLLSIKAFMN